jgi:leucyl-tRNA synthetase
MFIGPWEDGGPFQVDGISGIERWLNRAWNISITEPQYFDSPGGRALSPTGAGEGQEEIAIKDMRRITHQTARKVTEDYEGFHWNTAIAALMEMTNALSKARESGPVDRDAWREAIEKMLLLMAPLTPHIAEELWQRTGRSYSIHNQTWPTWDEALTVEDEITLVVQVNGKVRDRIQATAGITEDAAKELALASEHVQKHLEGAEPRKVIYVPGKLVNIVK